MFQQMVVKREDGTFVPSQYAMQNPQEAYKKLWRFEQSEVTRLASSANEKCRATLRAMKEKTGVPFTRLAKACNIPVGHLNAFMGNRALLTEEELNSLTEKSAKIMEIMC